MSERESQVKTYTHDWVGEWYSLKEEAGEFCRIRFGELVVGSESPLWHYLPHARFDGIGAFAEVLERTGRTDIGSLPRSRWSSPPALMRRPARPSGTCARLPLAPGGWVATKSEDARPLSVAWRIFPANESDALVARARRFGVSLNTWLLFALHGAIAKEALPDGMPTRWMVPVNLRGAVALPDPRANHFASIAVPVSGGERPADVHHRIRELLETGTPFESWNAMTMMAERFGVEGIRSLLSLPQPQVTGIFSNLGAWPPPDSVGETVDAARSWIFLPPVTMDTPLSAGCLVWKGCLSIAVQAHPVLSTNPADAERWVGAWARALFASDAP